jgi:hypothetical protein
VGGRPALSVVEGVGVSVGNRGWKGVNVTVVGPVNRLVNGLLSPVGLGAVRVQAARRVRREKEKRRRGVEVRFIILLG